MRLGLSGLSLLVGTAIAECVLVLNDSYPSLARRQWVESDGRGNVSFHLQGSGEPHHVVSVKRVPEAGIQRVVFVGGGTLHGGEMRSKSIASALLGRRLHERVGGAWDIVNLACPGLSASDVRRVAKLALRELAPDYLVVYTGHEEFLPEHCGRYLARAQFPWLERVLRPWQFLRVGRGAKWLLIDSRLAGAWRQVAWSRGQVHTESWLEHVRADVLANYEEQLFEITEDCIDAEARVILVEPVSNSREFGPVASVLDGSLGADERKRIQRGLVKARRLLEEGKTKACEAIVLELEALDPGVADLLHLQAALAWQAGKPLEARRLELRALGADELPLAASEALLQRLQAVAELQFLDPCTPWFDLERIPEPGEPAIFVDHVHLTLYGQYLLTCLLAAAIDPERDDPLEPFPRELEERLADYRRLCKRLELSSGGKAENQRRRLEAVLERAAISSSPERHLVRAREVVDTWTSDDARGEEFKEAAWVLALLEGDAELVRDRGGDVKAWNAERHLRLLQILRAHPRLSRLLTAQEE